MALLTRQNFGTENCTESLAVGHLSWPRTSRSFLCPSERQMSRLLGLLSDTQTKEPGQLPFTYYFWKNSFLRGRISLQAQRPTGLPVCFKR